MATNLGIDERLLAEAQRVAGLSTKRATVEQALRELIARRRQKEILDAAGALHWDPSYDYKRERRKRS